jgi:hypothetical protein
MGTSLAQLDQTNGLAGAVTSQFVEKRTPSLDAG